MAKKGDRTKLDLTIGDMNHGGEYEGHPPMIPVTFMTKLSKAKLESGEITNEDVCASCFSLIPWQLDTLLEAWAMLNQFSDLFVGGNFFQDNEYIQKQLGVFIPPPPDSQFYPNVYFLDHGGYIGAIGAVYAA